MAPLPAPVESRATLIRSSGFSEEQDSRPDRQGIRKRGSLGPYVGSRPGRTQRLARGEGREPAVVGHIRDGSGLWARSARNDRSRGETGVVSGWSDC
jgi:hypothetical protein